MVTIYRDWQVGDAINICASIEEFCGAENQFIYPKDINVTKSPDSCNPFLGYERGCGLHLNNVEFTFKLVKVSGTIEGNTCNPQRVYKTIGSTRTNSSGVARIIYIVSEQDRLDYINATSEYGYYYRVIACITNSDGQATTPSKTSIITDSITINQNLCYGVTCSDICIGNNLYYQVCNPTNGQCIQGTLKEANSLTCQSTHYIDVKIKAHSWYTPGGAADWIVTKVADINGALVNLFTGVTDYQYLGVEIFIDADYVIIRSYIKQLSTSSLVTPTTLVAPAVPLIAQIAAIVTTILYIVIVVGIIVGVGLYLITIIIDRIFGKDYTKAEVGGLLNDILQRNLDNCHDNFPNDPVGYANCVKSGLQSTTGAGGDFFEDPTITQAGNTAATTIDACTAQYNIDGDAAKLAACVDGANSDVISVIGEQTCNATLGHTWNKDTQKCEKVCSFPVLGQCLDTPLTIGAILLGGYIIYKVIKR